ncbi:MAG: putative scal-like, partial [Massilia sp.]|nr:putative scal-like [Massilia sp.]
MSINLPILHIPWTDPHLGLITVSRFSYLISITRRQQVAQIRGYPIYVITEVALTPCNSYQDASTAVASTAAALKRQHEADTVDAEDDSSDNDELSVSPPVEGEPDPISEDEERPKNVHRRSNSSIAEDVISRKGSYGRFAQRWFSRTGWAMDQKRNMGLTTAHKDEQKDEPQKAADQKPEVGSAAEAVQPLPEISEDAAGTGAGD